MGRNIWQSEHPVAMVRAVRYIVHGNANVEQAFQLYKKLVKEDTNKNKSKGNKPNQNKSKGKKPNQNKSQNPSTQDKK